MDVRRQPVRAGAARENQAALSSLDKPHPHEDPRRIPALGLQVKRAARRPVPVCLRLRQLSQLGRQQLPGQPLVRMLATLGLHLYRQAMLAPVQIRLQMAAF